MQAYRIEVRNDKGEKTRTWEQVSAGQGQAEANAARSLEYACVRDGEHVAIVEEITPASAFDAGLYHFAALLQCDKLSHMKAGGFDDVETVHFSSWHVTIKRGRKYINVDVGSSGVYMVTKEEGDIFSIKGYGDIHRGHHFGTLETVNGWYWGAYRGDKLSTERDQEPFFSFEGQAEEEEPAQAPAAVAVKSSTRGKVGISEDVAQVLQSAEVDGNDLRLTAQLDRPMYVAVNKVLAALGGKWNRGKGVHVFAGPVADVLAEALDTGHAIDKRKALNQFFTPPAIAARMIELAEIEAGMCVLEPSAGSGNLVRPIVEGVDTEILAYEVDEDLCFRLRSEFPSYRLQVRTKDFLTVTDHQGQYPRVVMNPPFENGLDIKHIEHARTFLRPGGKLVALCANGSRQQEAFKGIADHWEELPAGSFKSEGTGVSVALFTLTA